MSRNINLHSANCQINYFVARVVHIPHFCLHLRLRKEGLREVRSQVVI
jgi:hypothetical protein